MIAALLVLAATTPARGDRHCAPVLDLYYTARHAILERQAGCAERLRVALGRLDDARTAARNCGCDGLGDVVREGIDQAAGQAGGDAAGCPARAEAILAMAGRMDRAYEQCC